MSIFDAYLTEVAQYVQEMKEKGRPFREMNCPTTVNALKEGLPVSIGDQSKGGVILRRDTFIELGNPEVGSSAFLLWTDNSSLVTDGRITLIGSDIPESPGASLPLGQVLIVGGKEIGDKEHDALERSQYISDQIEGYMLRSTLGQTWGRVSKDAAARGFSFETLGRGLMALLKAEVPGIEAMEIVFVTSNKEDLQPLSRIAKQVQEIGRKISKEVWKAKGYDIVECGNGVSCGSCSSKKVCDDIREVINVQKKETGEDV